MPLTQGTSRAVIGRNIECVVCGAEFKIKLYRWSTAKYCSNTCKSKAMTHPGSGFVACVICGKMHRRRAAHMGYRHTCSLRCRGLADRTESPASKDFSSSTRRWLKRRKMLNCCGRCGYDDHPGILVIHHTDRDRTNNDIGNLEVLCPNCHALEHYLESRGGWNHASTRRRKPSGDRREHQGNGSVGA